MLDIYALLSIHNLVMQAYTHMDFDGKQWTTQRIEGQCCHKKAGGGDMQVESTHTISLQRFQLLNSIFTGIIAKQASNEKKR